VARVGRQLLGLETFDPVAGGVEGLVRFGVAGIYRGVDLGGGDAQASGIEIKPVELARRLEQRDIASMSHVIDDGAGGGLDIGGYLAVGPNKVRKPLG